MRIKRECKEGEDYFLSSGLRQPIRTSVNLPGVTDEQFEAKEMGKLMR